MTMEQRRAAEEQEKRDQVERSRWRDLAMLTLAPPHHASDDLGVIGDRMFAATAAFWRSKEWRAFVDANDIANHVRVLETTHGGAHGAHLHFHVALFLGYAAVPRTFIEAREHVDDNERRRAAERAQLGDRDMWERLYPNPDTRRRRMREKRQELERNDVRDIVASIHLIERFIAGERLPDRDVSSLLPFPLREQTHGDRQAFLDELCADLLPAWRRCCEAAGFVGVGDASIKLSPAEHASAYFAKWGLADEVGAGTAKSRSHLRLLDALANGCDRAGDAYLTFRRALDGKQWVTGFTDAMRAYEIDDDAIALFQDELRERRARQAEREGTPLVLVPPLTLTISSTNHLGVVALGWSRVFAFIDDVSARGGDVQRELDEFLWHARVRPTTGHHASSPGDTLCPHLEVAPDTPAEISPADRIHAALLAQLATIPTS